MEVGDTYILVYEDIELGYHNQYSYRLDDPGCKSQQVQEIFLSTKIRAQTSSGACPILQFNGYWVLL